MGFIISGTGEYILGRDIQHRKNIILKDLMDQSIINNENILEPNKYKRIHSEIIKKTWVDF